MKHLAPRRGPDLLAVSLLIAAAVTVLWRPILRGEVFLPLDLLAHLPPWRYSYERTPITNPIVSDLLLEHYPRRLLATQILRAGELPLWNPYIMSGMPLLADGYSALLYPLSILFVVLPLARAFGWYALLHLVIAGVGTYWLARGLMPRRLPAMTAGLTYMGCGFTMTWLGFPEFSAVIAWLPVALGCVEGYERTVAAGQGPGAGDRGLGVGYALAAAVVLALCVLCQIQLAAYAGAAVACYWLVRRAVAAPRRLPGALGALASVTVLASLLSAVQWLPTAELALDSQRRGAAGASMQTLGVSGLLRFVTPAIFGQARTAPGWGPPTQDALFPYVGFLPLLLAIIGAWGARTVQSLTLLLLALAMLMLSFAPGDVWIFLLQRVPLLDQLPAVYRWTMVLSLALALLAAYGLQTLLGVGNAATVLSAPGRRWPRRASRALCLATAGALLVSALGHLQLFTPHSRYGEYITLLRPQMHPWPLAIGGASIALVMGGLLTRTTGARRAATGNRSMAAVGRYGADGVGRRAWAIGLPALLLIVLDLGWYGLPLQSSADPRRLFRPTTDLLAAIGTGAVRDSLTTDLVYPPTRTSVFLSQDRGIYRVLGADYPSLQPNTFSVFGAQDVRGYASVFSADYLRFARRWEGKQGDEPGWAQIYLTQAYNTRALLDLMGVRYIFFNPRSENEARYTGLELVRRDDEGAIYHNPTALPRAWLVHAVEVLPDDEAVMERLTTPGFPVSTTALLTEAPPELAAARERERTTITRYTPREVTVEVQSAAPGLLVLSDAHYPGWEAFVDGQQAHIYTVDTILRGVVVPSGDHQVQFHYRPRSFLIGASVSLATWLVLLVYAVVSWRRGRV